MKQEFDLDKIGKKVPYRVPEAFFEEMQKNVMDKVNHPKRCRTIWLRLSPVIVAAAAVLSAVMFLPRNYEEENVGKISLVTVESSDWIEDMSDEDLQAMDEIAECDVFMY